METEMNPPQVTNWMIYELLKDFKEDTNRRFLEVDRRFSEIDNRFSEIDRKFLRVDGRFDKLQSEMAEDRKKLNEIYESRDYVTVKFTRTWAIASFLMAILASITTIAFEKALS